jgi:GT2 family glycosyltransferase
MITVVCILYNSDHLIEKFLDQIKKNKKIEKVIFFDNSKKINHSINSNVQIIGTGENLGYGGAINKAVSYAKSEWILVANPDLIIHENNLDETRLSKKTIYAPILILNKNKIYGYHFPNIFSDALLMSIFRYLKPFKKIVDRKSITNEEKFPKRWLQMGALILIPKYFFDKYEGFNEKYFLFFEEQDLYSRAINNGFEIKSAHFLSFENLSNSSENDVSAIKAFAEMDSFKKYYKDNKYFMIVIYLMRFFITLHFIIAKIISKFIKIEKISKRLKFLDYQLKGLKNKK